MRETLESIIVGFNKRINTNFEITNLMREYNNAQDKQIIGPNNGRINNDIGLISEDLY